MAADTIDLGCEGRSDAGSSKARDSFRGYWLGRSHAGPERPHGGERTLAGLHPNWGP
jgi:hypothetical protein